VGIPAGDGADRVDGVSRWRGHRRVVLEVVCQVHPEVILLRPQRDLRSGELRWDTTPTGHVGGGHLSTALEMRCTRPACRVNPQWRREKLGALLEALPEGVWRVTDAEMDRLIREPLRAVEYLETRRGLCLPQSNPDGC
jgi:hypothetical protein